MVPPNPRHAQAAASSSMLQFQTRQDFWDFMDEALSDTADLLDSLDQHWRIPPTVLRKIIPSTLRIIDDITASVQHMRSEIAPALAHRGPMCMFLLHLRAQHVITALENARNIVGRINPNLVE